MEVPFPPRSRRDLRRATYLGVTGAVGDPHKVLLSMSQDVGCKKWVLDRTLVLVTDGRTQVSWSVSVSTR